MRRVYALRASAQRGALCRFDQQAALSGRCGHRPASTQAISVAAAPPAFRQRGRRKTSRKFSCAAICWTFGDTSGTRRLNKGVRVGPSFSPRN
ncbi:hypothetical protein U0070_013506 [Myodes glareolus]|uniref:Uncharacterized protein n=1 Tax=Myodes glareolus TaxID=447135 RepID=A0AAW0HG63_MYOGA